jgi:hypothetical protein
VEANFIKLPGSYLVPASEEDGALLEKIPIGRVVKLKLTVMRNYEFHKKFMALVQMAFDRWQPAEIEDPKRKYITEYVPAKQLERFRKDLTIRAGFYETTFHLDGSIRIEAKSISFGKMSQEEFEKLFSAVINVVLKQVYDKDEMTSGELRKAVDRVMDFA